MELGKQDYFLSPKKTIDQLFKCLFLFFKVKELFLRIKAYSFLVGLNNLLVCF